MRARRYPRFPTRLLAATLTLALVGVPLLFGEDDGAEACVDCHAEVVESYRLSPHSRVAGIAPENTCTSCHGDASEHVQTGDPAAIRNLGEIPMRESSGVCLECHASQPSQWHYETSLHAMSDVGCVSCHNSHATSEHMLRKPTEDLCVECHTNVDASFSLRRHHPNGENSCSDCHNPHGSKSEAMVRSQGRGACVECHQDKAGPYLYEHDVSIVEGCTSCHRVHGSTNRHLLNTQRQNNLCYQCHPGTTTPGFHGFSRFLGEKCTACHTAIHGSNTNPYFLED